MSTAIVGAFGGFFVPQGFAFFGFLPAGTFGFLAGFYGFGKGGFFEEAVVGGFDDGAAVGCSRRT